MIGIGIILAIAVLMMLIGDAEGFIRNAAFGLGLLFTIGFCALLIWRVATL